VLFRSGINLAMQDAVAAANELAAPLAASRVGEEHLRRIQARREFPTRVTQRLQLAVQKRVVKRVLEGTGTAMAPPFALRLIAAIPLFRRIPARLVGLGVRPEHVLTPEAPLPAQTPKT